LPRRCWTSVACYFLLLPDDLIDFGKSAAAASGFASNFYFWKTSGYLPARRNQTFAAHLVALGRRAIYIFAPILIYVLTRLSARKSLWVLALIMLISLCASVARSFWRRHSAFSVCLARLGIADRGLAGHARSRFVIVLNTARSAWFYRRGFDRRGHVVPA
jgi:hypothetical protein